jgi:hypothetical protein
MVALSPSETGDEMTVGSFQFAGGNATRRLAISIGCSLLAIAFGCGRQGPERVIVSGAVTYQGKPLPEGCIRLVAIRETAAPVTVAAIVAGRYTLKSHGGVPVGTHRIEITAYRPNKKQPHADPAASDVPGMESSGVVVQYLPEKYNAKSTLEITVPSGSGAITKNFDLTD